MFANTVYLFSRAAISVAPEFPMDSSSFFSFFDSLIVFTIVSPSEKSAPTASVIQPIGFDTNKAFIDAVNPFVAVEAPMTAA